MFYRLLAASTLILAVITGGPPPAPAQQNEPPVIAVIDYARAMRESKAGQQVREQVDKQRAIYQAEIKSIQTKLEESRQELQQQQAVLAPEVFARRRQEYQQQAESLQRTAQSRKRSLDQMQAQGFGEIEKVLRDVLQTLVEERGYDIVMNAGQGTSTIVMASRELFITEEAIKRLDAKLPSVTVKPTSE